MEETKEKLAQYHVSLKQPQPQQNYSYYSYNSAQRQALQEETMNKTKESFFKVVNEVVALGGVICMDKQQLDSEWRLIANSFSIRILPSLVGKIEALPEVQSCAYQNVVI